MKISYVMRNPGNHAFSIEKVFSAVLPVISEKAETEMVYMPASGAKPNAVIRNLMAARKIQADIIHITGDVHYVALVTPKNKTVITVHDLVTLENNKGFKRAVLKLFWFTLPLKRCKRIIAISEKTKRDIIAEFPQLEGKIIVIPDPVDHAFVYSGYEFNNEVPTILQIGTKENKNLLRVAEALRDIRCKLQIIGKLNQTQIEVLEKNKIVYENCYQISDEELIEKYKQCDMVVFASTYEGFGMPIIEAQSIGRPIVTSNIEPMITVSGPKSCLVDPFSAASIREGILKIINDKVYRQSLISAGIENSKKYSDTSVGEQYINAYSDMRKGE